MTKDRRFGVYFSHQGDAKLISEIQGGSSKTEMIRRYALLGFQKGLELCERIKDEKELNAALAEAFASENEPPDFRAASEFIKARNALCASSNPAKVASEPKPEPVASKAASSTPSNQPEVQKPAEIAPSGEDSPSNPKPGQWGSLRGLVAGNQGGHP